MTSVPSKSTEKKHKLNAMAPKTILWIDKKV